MKLTSKRIALDKTNLFEQSIAGTEKPTAERVPNYSDEIGDFESSATTSALCAALSLHGTDVPGYEPARPAKITDFTGVFHPSCHGYPSTRLSFKFDKEDAPRVNAWFTGNYRGVTAPESTTLVRNRLAALQGVLHGYFAAAEAHNILTAPVRATWRVRYSNGTVGTAAPAATLAVIDSAPLIPVYSHTVTADTLLTEVDIHNIPARLHLTISPDFTEENIDEIEIFATRPTPLWNPGGTTAALRSATVAGTPRRCWNYDSLSPLEIADATRINTDFRRIATIAATEFPAYAQGKELPMNTGIFANFNSLPKLTDQGSNPPDTAADGRHRFISAPLHLSLPDTRKSVSRVQLDGTFLRAAMRWRLLGSDNRRNWHKIAEARGDTLGGMCAARFKWFLIEADCTLRSDELIDAVTFYFRT